MDDLLTEEQTVEKIRKITDTVTDIFEKAPFKLHRWNSNARELETSEAASNEGGTTYAKEQVGMKPEECGPLRLR